MKRFQNTRLAVGILTAAFVLALVIAPFGKQHTAKAAGAPNPTKVTVYDSVANATISINSTDRNPATQFLTDGSIGSADLIDAMGNHQTLVYFNNVSIATTDNTTNGACGSATIYTFPLGLIHWKGSCIKATVTATGSLTTTAAFVGALGTTAVSGTLTLSGTNANLVPSGAATLTSSVGTLKDASSSTALLDGTTTTTTSVPLVIKANWACPDAGSSGAGTLTMIGVATLNWASLGDK